MHIYICVYSSETGGVWGDVLSTTVQSQCEFMVGFRNVILFGGQLRILEFDLGSQNIAVNVIEVPLPSNAYANHRSLYLSTH